MRRNVLAAPADAVLDSVLEQIVAVCIDCETVAGMEPAVAPSAGSGGIVAVIAMVHGPGLIGADHQLTGCAGRHLDIVLVYQPQLHTGTRPAAYMRLGRVRATAQRRADLGHVKQRVDFHPEARGEFRADRPKRHDEHQFANNGVVIGPMLYRNLSYQVLRDFKPISQVTAMTHLLVMASGFSANSVAELIEFAKKNPHQLTFASSGTGATDHMAGELFKHMANIKIEHVPYKGGPPALADTASGQVTMYFSGLPSAIPLVAAGKLKALGITGTGRSKAMPNVPTIAEANLPDYAVTNWYGLFGPKMISNQLVEQVALSVSRVLELPDIRSRFDGLGIEIVGSSPAQFADLIKREFDVWTRVVKAANLRAE